ncbi:hypothetical protein [Diaphorobacter sp.]|uniref:hypothetical protein n=1 Tax=Diaphorobacter sp. TaxID=1934310 RepID=UPI0028AB9802|nr:hypothetical protein [Diaphorobacter sp.]
MFRFLAKLWFLVFVILALLKLPAVAGAWSVIIVTAMLLWALLCVVLWLLF